MGKIFQIAATIALGGGVLAGLFVVIPLLFSNPSLSLPQHSFPENFVLPQPSKEEVREQVVVSPPPLRAQQEEIQTILTRSGILIWTNVSRITNNLQPIVENSLLDAAAESKFQDMFSGQYFAHVSPTGKDAPDLARGAGYEFVIIGENLALGNFKDDKTLVHAWMDSPGHRANILGARYTEIGIATGKGLYEGRETWLAVQIFALPLSACPPKPSPELLSQIEAQKSQLDSYAQELETKKQRVEEYTILVEVYNKLLEQTKSLVLQYNQEIEAFNACIHE